MPRDKGTSLKNKWRSGQSFNSGVRSKTKESNSDRSQSDGSSGGIHDSGVASSTYSSDREKENRILETQFKIREKLSKVVKRARYVENYYCFLKLVKAKIKMKTVLMFLRGGG